MIGRVCLVTTGQPSTNPRLVKEADALSANGCDVHVVGAHWADWAERTDASLLGARRWSAHVIDWRREKAPWLFWKTRARHFLARTSFGAPIVGRAFAAAAGRLTPELTAAALSWPADLYIAHNLGALPAAAAAARRLSARLGFDAEDHHSGQWAPDASAERALVQAIEEQFVPACDYVTAASPGIASAYAALCRRAPVVILNVFPLADRPVAPHGRREGPIRLYWFSQTIGRERGLETAVAAMGRLADVPIELHLRGVWQNGFADVLRQVARSAGVPWDRIVFHEPAPPAEMVRLAAAYDAGLALETGHTPNADVALSNKIFAYLLAGIPVLASATTGQAELARDLGEAVALAPVGEAGALAAVLRRWTDQPLVLDAARRAAWDLGTARYHWEAEQRAFLEVVRTALAEPRHSEHARGLAS